MDIVEALDAGSGTTCVVGAGGKKTTLYRLADLLDCAVVSATVRIPIFDTHVERVVVTDDPVSAVDATDDWPVGVVPARERSDRYRGYDPAVVDDLVESGVADAILVKADGARNRLFKAPGEREPQVPTSADTVIPIASVHAVGEPLSAESVHRPETVAAITGLAEGERIGAADVAAVLASDQGGLKGVPEDATVVPLINMVDDAESEATAREVADGVLARADVERVVLARMNATDPLVAVID